jgi:hypothetical protein
MVCYGDSFTFLLLLYIYIYIYIFIGKTDCLHGADPALLRGHMLLDSSISSEYFKVHYLVGSTNCLLGCFHGSIYDRCLLELCTVWP